MAWTQSPLEAHQQLFEAMIGRDARPRPLHTSIRFAQTHAMVAHKMSDYDGRRTGLAFKAMHEDDGSVVCRVLEEGIDGVKDAFERGVGPYRPRPRRASPAAR